MRCKLLLRAVPLPSNWGRSDLERITAGKWYGGASSAKIGAIPEAAYGDIDTEPTPVGHLERFALELIDVWVVAGISYPSCTAAGVALRTDMARPKKLLNVSPQRRFRADQPSDWSLGPFQNFAQSVFIPTDCRFVQVTQGKRIRDEDCIELLGEDDLVQGSGHMRSY